LARSRSVARVLRHRAESGGPNYLRRFATEQTVTINTAAAGGTRHCCLEVRNDRYGAKCRRSVRPVAVCRKGF